MRIPRWLVRTSVRYPRLVLGIWGTVLALAVAGVSELRIDTSTESVLDHSDSEWSFYQRSLQLFGGDEVVVLAIPSKSPFDPGSLALVERLTREIREIPGVRRVDSLSSVPLIESTPDGGVSLEPALSAGVPTTAADGSNLAERVRRDRIAPRVLVSEDGRLVAVNILLDGGIGERIESTIDLIQGLLPDQVIWMSGVPVFRTETNKRTVAEITFFVVLTIIVMAGFLYAVFRSGLAVVFPLAAGGTGTWILLAAMGALGSPMSLTTMILPSVMLAVGCANVMHVITQAVGVVDSRELGDALDPVILPIMLSGLTTTIGFLAISGVPIEAVQAIGTYGALGVATILLATLTALPSALAIWPLPPRELPVSNWVRRRLCPWLVRVLHAGRLPILGLWCLGGAAAFVGLSRLTIETDATTWFPRGSSVRDSYEEIRAGLSGISPMNVVVESTNGQRVTRPEVISAIANLTEYLQGLPEVGRALSLADPIRELHEGFADGRNLPLPDSRSTIEQYLLLLESVEQVQDLVTPDRLAANIILRVDSNGSEDLQFVARAATGWWERHGPPGFSARATGIMYEFARAENEISIGQIRGLCFALLSVGIVLVAIFRSARLAVSTLVANALPIIIAFGAMGLLGVPLDAGTVVVGNLAFGIAIDETLHLVSALRETRADGAFGNEALETALERCVPAVLYTTGTVALGFGVLAFSQFTFTRNLGILTAAVMVLCFVADVALLPALLQRRPITRDA